MRDTLFFSFVFFSSSSYRATDTAAAAAAAARSNRACDVKTRATISSTLPETDSRGVSRWPSVQRNTSCAIFHPRSFPLAASHSLLFPLPVVFVIHPSLRCRSVFLPNTYMGPGHRHLKLAGLLGFSFFWGWWCWWCWWGGGEGLR